MSVYALSEKEVVDLLSNAYETLSKVSRESNLTELANKEAVFVRLEMINQQVEYIYSLIDLIIIDD